MTESTWSTAGAAASSFDKLRMRLPYLADAMKYLPHAELVEARTAVMQPTFRYEAHCFTGFERR